MTPDEREKRLEWLVEHQPEVERWVEQRERWEWLSGMMKTVAMWLAAILTAWFLMRQALSELLPSGRPDQ